jgi:hypothetical protein
VGDPRDLDGDGWTDGWRDDPLAPEADGPVAEAGPARSYLRVTRGFFASVVLVAPLWTLYQIGILTTDGWRNGVDFITPRLYDLVGGHRLAYFGVSLAVLVALVIAAQLMGRHQKPRLSDLGLVTLESALYAGAIGYLITKLLHLVGVDPPTVSLSVVDNFVLSLGAGVYEELVFRLLLLSGLLAAGRALELSRSARLGGAFVLSSLLFAAFHYVPIGSDPWELWSFAFRFCAGLCFAALYVVRGFAVAVYTHAIYDIYVLVLP